MTMHQLSRLNKVAPTEMETAERDAVVFCSDFTDWPQIAAFPTPSTSSHTGTTQGKRFQPVNSSPLRVELYLHFFFLPLLLPKDVSCPIAGYWSSLDIVALCSCFFLTALDISIFPFFFHICSSMLHKRSYFTQQCGQSLIKTLANANFYCVLALSSLVLWLFCYSCMLY